MSTEIVTIDNREGTAVRCRLDIRYEDTHWVGSLIRVGRHGADELGRLTMPLWATTPQQARQQLHRLALSRSPIQDLVFASPRPYGCIQHPPVT